MLSIFDKISPKIKKILLFVLISLLLVLGYFIHGFYGNNTLKDYSLYIRSGANYTEVLDSLQKNYVLDNVGNFHLVSKILKYHQLIKPGHYFIKKNMSMVSLVKKLRSGNQDPVTIRFESKRLLNEIFNILANHLEINENQIIEAATNEEFLKENHLTKETLISIFIPNTYQLYWNIKPEKLLDFFVNERNKFFQKHSKQLQNLGMNEVQISILASIIEAETYQDTEKKRISGVYHNRLKKNMRLQADPTVIFAIGDFSKTRVLKSDLQIDSPYNTYKYSGLPIGPINAPGIASLEAALYPENHDYIFFCARPDFSGFHDFSSDYNEHLKQAKAYQSALEKLQMKK